MANSFSCHCSERLFPEGMRNWVVTKFRCNYSAFNGYHRTSSEWSTVVCRSCGGVGRTKAAFVFTLMNLQRGEAWLENGKYVTKRDSDQHDMLTARLKFDENEKYTDEQQPLIRCAANKDGDCNHPDCPQKRDDEPFKSGRHCPIDTWPDRE